MLILHGAIVDTVEAQFVPFKFGREQFAAFVADADFLVAIVIVIVIAIYAVIVIANCVGIVYVGVLVFGAVNGIDVLAVIV